MRSIAVMCAAASVSIAWSRPRRVAITLPEPGTLISALTAFILGWTAAAALGMPGVPALVGGAVAAAVPHVVRRRGRERASRHATQRWPDFLAAVRSRLATGAAIPAACAEAGRHVGGRFVELAAPTGIPFAQTIAVTRDRWADPLADRILTTLELANTVGGSHVSAVLGALTASVNEDLRLRRAHEAALTEQRLTAGVALVAPWAILALSVMTNPASADAFATGTGNLIIAGGFAATIVGYALARRSARLSQPPRLFT